MKLVLLSCLGIVRMGGLDGSKDDSSEIRRGGESKLPIARTAMGSDGCPCRTVFPSLMV